MTEGPHGEGPRAEGPHGEVPRDAVPRGAVDLLDRLRSGEVLIGDGALGTQLIARGLEPGEAPESWNLTRPEVLEEIARLYAEAGSEFVSTNTFGGSPIKLAASGLEGRMEEINRAAVAAVRRAVGNAAFGGAVGVFGSVGPCGRLLTPYGDADPAEVRAGFVAQIRILVDAGVDLIGIETMTDLREAVLAVEAAREATGAPGSAGAVGSTGPLGSAFAAEGRTTTSGSTGAAEGATKRGSIPIAVTMTFESTRRGFFTIMGNDIPAVAATLAAAGADILGSNCGKGIEEMIAVAHAFHAATDRPLLFQPNAGLPTVVEGELIYRETPEVFAARVRDLVAAGASIVGGCCGTTPEHIRLAKRAVRG